MKGRCPAALFARRGAALVFTASVGFIAGSAACGDDEPPKAVTAKLGEPCGGTSCECSGVLGDTRCLDCAKCPEYAFSPTERVLLRCGGDHRWIVEAYCAGGGEAICPRENRCTGHDGKVGGYRYGGAVSASGTEKTAIEGTPCRRCLPCDPSQGPCFECVTCDTFAANVERTAVLKCGDDAIWHGHRSDCFGQTLAQCDPILKTFVVCLDREGRNQGADLTVRTP